MLVKSVPVLYKSEWYDVEFHKYDSYPGHFNIIPSNDFIEDAPEELWKLVRLWYNSNYADLELLDFLEKTLGIVY